MQDMIPSQGGSAEPHRQGQEDIDASRMPLMDHLVELRQRLIYSLIAFAVMFILCFTPAPIQPSELIGR